MNKRIQKSFALLKQQHRMGFMPFLVAGDPDLKTSLKIAKVVARHADFLEIGFPFSDPIADGPVIQAANQRALQVGINPDKVFSFIGKLTNFTAVPITILIYSNLVLRYGINKFYDKAKKAGVSGILLPDVPVEEIRPFYEKAKRYGLDQILLVASTTTDVRLRKILQYASGYVYAVSVLGVTGPRKTLSPTALQLVKKIKLYTNLPVVAGFGISTRQQANLLRRQGASGYIIGSALIDFINKHRTKPKFCDRLTGYLQSLKI